MGVRVHAWPWMLQRLSTGLRSLDEECAKDQAHQALKRSEPEVAEPEIGEGRVRNSQSPRNGIEEERKKQNDQICDRQRSGQLVGEAIWLDRKSTRLNSSH